MRYALNFKYLSSSHSMAQVSHYKRKTKEKTQSALSHFQTRPPRSKISKYLINEWNGAIFFFTSSPVSVKGGLKREASQSKRNFVLLPMHSGHVWICRVQNVVVVVLFFLSIQHHFFKTVQIP